MIVYVLPKKAWTYFLSISHLAYVRGDYFLITVSDNAVLTSRLICWTIRYFHNQRSYHKAVSLALENEIVLFTFTTPRLCLILE